MYMRWCTLLALCESVGWWRAHALYSLQVSETASPDMLASMKNKFGLIFLGPV